MLYGRQCPNCKGEMEFTKEIEINKHKAFTYSCPNCGKVYLRYDRKKTFHLMKNIRRNK